MRIVVTSSKGGVGKTTVAVNVAAWLARRQPVFLHTTDFSPDRLAELNLQTRGGIEIVDLPAWVPFDPAVSEHSNARLILVPIQPTPAAWFYAVELFDQYAEAKGVLNQVRYAGKTMVRAQRNFLEEVRRSEYRDRLMRTRLTFTAACEAALMYRQTIFEYDPRGRTAQECKKLAREVERSVKA